MSAHDARAICLVHPRATPLSATRCPRGITIPAAPAPLTDASQFGNLECIRLLLQRGAKANTTAGSGQTPLFMSTNNRIKDGISLECLTVLLDGGADQTVGDSDHETPLLVACRQQDAEAVALLLEHAERALTTHGSINGLSKEEFVDQGDHQGATPLSWATQRGNVQIASLLLDHGCASAPPCPTCPTFPSLPTPFPRG